jgi:predicted phosphodiesterase
VFLSNEELGVVSKRRLNQIFILIYGHTHLQVRAPTGEISHQFDKGFELV